MLKIFPLSKSMKEACSLPLDKNLPLWIKGCLQDEKKSLYIDLFDPNLKFHDLDNETLKLINLHALEFIQISKLKKIPISHISHLNVREISPSQAVINALIKNNFTSVGDVGDIRNLKLSGVGKLNYLCIYSALSVISEINLPDSQNNIPQDETREVSVEYSLQQKKELLEKFIFKNALSQITLIDPRFQDQRSEILKIIKIESIESSESWLGILQIVSASLNYPDFSNLLNSLKLKIQGINSLSLEQQMQNFYEFTKLGQHKYFMPIMDRIGLKESEVPRFTLEETGQLCGITRERIRQIEAKYLLLNKRLNGNRVFMPQLEKIQRLIKENEFKTQSLIEQEIKKAGYGNWNLRRILGAMDLFNHFPKFSIQDDIVYSGDDAENIHRILVIAKKIVSYNGAVELNFLHEIVSSEMKVSKDALKEIIISKFINLDESWFFIKTNHNLIDALSQRMFNFAKTQDIYDIREAHKKYVTLREPNFYRDESRTGFYGFLTPPSKIISKILIKLGHEVVNSNVTCCELANTYLDVDGSGDNMFFDFFESRAFEPATVSEMQTALVLNRGMAEGSFYQYCTYKPYIKRYATGVFGITGHYPSEEIIQSTSERRVKHPSPVFEILENGNMIVKSKITNTVGSYVLQIPSEYSRFLTAEEFYILHDNENYATIKASREIFYYGAGRYLKNILFCELYDFIKFEFFLDETKLVTVKLITEGEFHSNL